jgi:polysaccharide transporter, PST family
VIPQWKGRLPGRGVRSLVNRQVIQNAFALYASMFGNYILPLVTVPYLARVLGPDAWGSLLFVQAIGIYIVMVVEYSFDFTGSRQTTRTLDDSNALRDTVAGVIGARLILGAAATAVLGVAYLTLPIFRETGSLFWFGVYLYLFTALRPFWFFLGIERVRGFLVVELSLKASAVLGIVLFVNGPSDAWLVLALQGTAAALAMCAGMIMVYRMAPFRWPTPALAIAALRDGINLFLLRVSSSVYAFGNTIILGFLAAPAIVGFYAGAERIHRIIVSAMWPVLFASFPRATQLAQDDPLGGARLARMSTIAMFILATIGSIFVYLMSPIIVRVILGPGFEEAARVLRILALLLPITSPTITLQTQWLVPSGQEGLLTRIAGSASIMHIPIAIVLGSLYFHIGVAWALVIVELYIVLMLLAILSVRKLGPFRLPEQQPAQTPA